MQIIDRRSNPGQKSLENRQRFLRRAKTQVQKAVKNASGNANVKDVLNGGSVELPIDGVAEPRLVREGGVRNRVLPGNKKFVEGDILDRQGESRRKGSGPGEGDSTDSFRFVLTREEFMDLFMDDLELPNMHKKTLAGSLVTKPRRAGYTMSGSPTAISVNRTMRLATQRRMALGRPTQEQVMSQWQIAQDVFEETQDEGLWAPEYLKYMGLSERMGRIPFIDPIDVRYRRFEQEPTPIAQAVMFCLMDVSGSMSEHMKDLAKRFYMLLYVFLERRYKKVEVVFIRHTDKAEEVDEDTFFHAPASGGTLVSTVLEEMARIVKDRFNPAEWNIYAAQASDGDNMNSDNTRTGEFMTDKILPVAQYFAYLEVGENETTEHMHMPSLGDSPLWKTYDGLCSKGASIAMRKVGRREDIFPVFHELFEKKGNQHASQ